MIYLNVPYAEKDDAKKKGARWDADKRLWYVPANALATPFERWMGHGKAAEAMLAAKAAEENGRPKALKQIHRGERRLERTLAKKNTLRARPVKGALYFDLEHKCCPFSACQKCAPTLDSSGWSAGRLAAQRAMACAHA